jgi:hypothetical protein
MSKVLDLEGTATHWSLFNRFVMAAQMLDAADAAGERAQRAQRAQRAGAVQARTWACRGIIESLLSRI